MKKTFRRFVRSFAYGQKGFTLVELLVVVAILGILAAVAVPSLSGLTARAKTSAQSAELSTVQTAIDAYMADKSLATITAGDEVQNFSAYKPNGVNAVSPDYLRSTSTHGFYDISTAGLVTLGTGGYP